MTLGSSTAALYGVGVAEARCHPAPRCHRCQRQFAAYLTEPYSLRCPRCKATNAAGTPPTTALADASASTGTARRPGPPRPARAR